ncbi:P1 family peptidase [Nocardia sp. alder85J]|uniref:P1 family peptidase n=1 Tax=Nocardia sp. alder85J TaxID=2862949 RepID=UPI001CD1A98F|nr:P1 family peptidase [Nocardia sp. alder85J]MCX4092015.1 P1 family peptidase [Nocardia sp. alder85J]
MKIETGPRNALTDVAGLLVGHHHELDATATKGAGAATGSTVIRAPGGVTAAVDIRGGGPGTRETDLLDPHNTVRRVHAILLTGGSAYGLAAADGVMRWLEEHGEGLAMDAADPAKVVPVVSGAVIFDLPLGAWDIRPTAEFGYRAAAAAGTDVARGCVGAGTGAQAGVLKGGIGTASVRIADGTAAGCTVAALVAVNAAGSVFDPRTGLPWGVGSDGADHFGLSPGTPDQLARAAALPPKGTSLNTTIGVVATDAVLESGEAKRLAMAAHDGLSRAVRPAHTPLDGDTFFALATGARVLDPEEYGPKAPMAHILRVADLCAAAALATERAIVDGVLSAHGIAGIPSYTEVFGS